MKFKTHNDATINPCGTHLQGYIKAPYTELVKVFGEPTNGDGYKTDVEWTIQFDDGIIATIYDYKTGINYNGKNGTPAPKNLDWHIGGLSDEVVTRIKTLLEC